MAFSNKVRELALRTSSGYCNCSDECTKEANEFHHMFSNTKVNRKLYPLFIDSLFNCCPINHDCHMSKSLPRIPEKIAMAYEEYLGSLK